jgi:transcriptional regulator GlxA family with amidase domain
MQQAKHSRRQRVGILAFDGVKLLDVAGPAEAFNEAKLLGAGYELVILSPDGRDVASSVGMTVSVAAAATDPDSFDTVLVAGGDSLPLGMVPAELVEAARHLSRHTRRMASVCTGAFVLAEAGLLEGRRATTHWQHTEELARRHRSIQVQPDAIFVKDGGLYTSAGVTAGIDLALALIEEDCGADLARNAARSLVVYMQRSGGQSQFSAPLHGTAPSGSPLRLVLDAIRADPAAPHAVTELAESAHLSTRHLTRLFRQELGTTPRSYIALVRFDTARALLDAGYSISEAAQRSGFGNPEALRRSFVAHIGVPPSKYQRRFGSTGPGSGPGPGPDVRI